MPRLSEQDIVQKLQSLSGWTLNEKALESNFDFSDFNEALAFINKVGIEAEKANHHPEIYNVYNKVKLRLSTHDEDGITQMDFDMAENINKL